MLGFKVPSQMVFSFLSEIQSKRQERKRRSTANPAYSGLFEPEVCLPVIVSLNNFMAKFVNILYFAFQRKRLASNYLNSVMFLSARGKIDLYFCQHNGVGVELKKLCMKCTETCFNSSLTSDFDMKGWLIKPNANCFNLLNTRQHCCLTLITQFCQCDSY